MNFNIFPSVNFCSNITKFGTLINSFSFATKCNSLSKHSKEFPLFRLKK